MGRRMTAGARLWFLGLSLIAATSCARDGREAGQEPESPAPAQATVTQDDPNGGMSEDEIALANFQVELGKFKAKVRPEGPAMADLTRHFFVLWEQGALAGSVPKTALEQVSLHKSPGREGNDYFLVWLEEKGHDMSQARACDELYQAHAELAPDQPEMRYFFCSREAGFELLSTYRQGAAGWTVVD